MYIASDILRYHMVGENLIRGSDYSGNHTKLSKILLNGNNICMVCIQASLYKFIGLFLPIVDSGRRRTCGHLMRTRLDMGYRLVNQGCNCLINNYTELAY